MAGHVRSRSLNRRELLLKTVPSCALACAGLGRVPCLSASTTPLPEQERHKFDLPLDPPPPPLTSRSLTQIQNRTFVDFVRVLREEMGEAEVIRLLNGYSESLGRRTGEAGARRVRDAGGEPTFQSFVDQFRPPRYGTSLTHEIVTDTEDTFELRVTECVWAEVFRQAGMADEIGHAAVCNMDYAWPTAYNPAIRMERSKTLMQGHDCCNHRYLLNA